MLNIQVGKNWLSGGESALTQVEDLLNSTRVLAVQMSTASISATERQNVVGVVDGYLNQIISLANSQVGGRYIFGGTNTETTPFVLNAGGTQVDYFGNDTPFSIKMGKDTNIEIGRDGEDIFGDNWDDDNFFKTLIDLKTYLQTNDVTEIQGTLDKLDSHLSKLRAVISDIGGKTTRMEVKENVIQELEIAYKDRKSSIEDAELAYNAALNSSSKIMQLSLVNFL